MEVGSYICLCLTSSLCLPIVYRLKTMEPVAFKAKSVFPHSDSHDDPLPFLALHTFHTNFNYSVDLTIITMIIIKTNQNKTLCTRVTHPSL